MKKIITPILIFTAILIADISNAQAPQGMNYQAVARNASGTILANQHISLRITITDGSGGSTVYQETDTAYTNQFGLFTLNIGNGTPVIGTFSAIDWNSFSAWMDVAFDPAGGTSYVNMGTSELLSVPYALSAASSQQWKSNGNDINNANSGNVGIGTNAPANKFSIVDSSATHVMTIQNKSNEGWSSMEFTDTTGAGRMSIGYASPGNTFLSDAAFINSGPPLVLSTQNAERMRILPTGEVGIGTSTPAALLDVNGNVRITDGTQGNGKVLTSDNVGNASWQDAVAHVGFGVYTTSAQTLPTIVYTTVVFPDEEFDDGNNYDTLTSTFTVPSDGLYHFDVNLSEDGGAAGSQGYIMLSINGGVEPTTQNTVAAGSITAFVLSANFKLHAGDTVRVLAESFGQNQIVYAGARSSFFSGYKVY